MQYHARNSIAIWPYRDSWAPAHALACGNRVGMKTTSPSSSPAHIPPPLQKLTHVPCQTGSVLRCSCAAFGRCAICIDKEKETKGGRISALCQHAEYSVRRDVCESKAGQFPLTLSLLSMCFAYGHTPLALSPARLQETPARTLVVQSWAIQIQMLCYLEVAWGRIEQLRGCAVLNVYCTAWQ